MKVSKCQPDSSVADPPAVAAGGRSGPDHLEDGSVLEQTTPHESKPSQSKGNDADCDALGASEAKDDGKTTGTESHCHYTCMPSVAPMLLQGVTCYCDQEPADRL